MDRSRSNPNLSSAPAQRNADWAYLADVAVARTQRQFLTIGGTRMTDLVRNRSRVRRRDISSQYSWRRIGVEAGLQSGRLEVRQLSVLPPCCALDAL